MKSKVNFTESKRFFVRKSLIGKKAIIRVTWKDGKVETYSHDEAYNAMKAKLEQMPCWEKYKSYTSSSALPKAVREIANKH
jgi:recombination DNA repair RAD52 pathway protein